MILVEILTALSLVGELQQMSLPIQGGRQMSRFQLCIQHTSHNRQGAQETRVLSSCNELRHAPKCGLNVHQVECGPMQGGWVYVQVVYMDMVRTLAFGLPAGLHSFAQHSIFPRHCHHDAMKIDWAPRPWAFERGSLIFV